MITLLLIVIAVLLFVLASKIAPEELNSVWIICVVAGVVYLLFQYWMYPVAIGYYLVINGKDLLYSAAEQPVFQILILGSLAGYWIWQAYLNREKIIKGFRTEFYSGFKLFLKLFAWAIGIIVVITGLVFGVGYFFIK